MKLCKLLKKAFKDYGRHTNGLPNMLFTDQPGTDAALDEKVQQLVQEFDAFMDDDFSTPKY
jgi:hypothetical protein